MTRASAARTAYYQRLYRSSSRNGSRRTRSWPLNNMKSEHRREGTKRRNVDQKEAADYTDRDAVEATLAEKAKKLKQAKKKKNKWVWESRTEKVRNRCSGRWWSWKCTRDCPVVIGDSRWTQINYQTHCIVRDLCPLDSRRLTVEQGLLGVTEWKTQCGNFCIRHHQMNVIFYSVAGVRALEIRQSLLSKSDCSYYGRSAA